MVSIIKLASDNTSIDVCADYIRQGHIVAFPTETVVGIATDANNKEAIEYLYAVKARPDNKPLQVMVENLAHAEEVGKFSDEARALADEFWPGPLTIVVAKQKNAPISYLVNARFPTVGIRVPRHPVTMGVIKAFGKPIVATSANLSGGPDVSDVSAIDPEVQKKLSVVLDDEQRDVRARMASTVIDCSHYPLKILRHGFVTEKDIRRVLGSDVALEV